MDSWEKKVKIQGRVKKFVYFLRLTTITRVNNSHDKILEQDKTKTFTRETI